MSYPFEQTEDRHHVSGDPVVIRKSDGMDFYDRHGVIGQTQQQLDAIEAIRTFISVSSPQGDALPKWVRYISGVSYPDSMGRVIVAGWTGHAVSVDSSGSVRPVRQRYRPTDEGSIEPWPEA